MNQWTEYQPHREREKELYDIRLRDGTELMRCYPNGNAWNANMYGEAPGHDCVADYRVTHIRLSEKGLGNDL